jgi:hypothetical protein
LPSSLNTRTAARDCCLALLETGFPEVGVQVDESGKRLQAGRVDRDGLRGAEAVAALGDHALVDEQIGRRAVGERRPGDEDSHTSTAVAVPADCPLSTR